MSGFFGNTTSTTTTADGYGGLIQSLFTGLDQDGYTIARSPVFAPLLSQTVITSSSGESLTVSFSVSFGANTPIDGAIFRVLVNGVVEQSTSTGLSSASNTQSASMVFYKTVGSGTHTVSVEWAKSKTDQPCASIYILAGSEPETYHASLLIQEVE